MNDRPLIDRRFTINDRYTLTECILPDGEGEFWIIDRRSRDDEDSVTIPEHELTGPLPRHIADRLGLTCAAPTRDHGRPCKNPVQAFGNRCRWHQHPASQETLPGVCAR